MKNVKEIIKDLEIEIDEEKQKQLEKDLLQNYRTIAEIDKQKEKHSADIKKRDDDLKELQQQLKDAGASKTKLDEVTGKLADLQNEYENSKADYEKQLANERYKFAVRDKIDNLKFSSDSAKQMFENKVIEKQLPMEDNKILGFDDFVKDYKESDKNAFLDDETPKPNFAGKTDNIDKDDKKEIPVIW